MSPFTVLLAVLLGLSNLSLIVAEKRPNFLILYADDLGIGDIGCFGNDTIRTPHIDSMCKNGAKLSHHLAAAAICTPSRAALMTGRLPIRSGMAARMDAGMITSLNSYAGLPANETTFPKILQQQGYKTGLVGKWHLGVHCENRGDYCHFPTNHGFDYFFGTPLSNVRGLGDDPDTIEFMIFPTLKRNLLIAALCAVAAAFFLYKKVGVLPSIVVGFLGIAAPGWVYILLSNPHILNSGFWRNNELVEQPIDFDRMSLRLVNEGLNFLKQRQNDKEPFLLMMSWLQVHTFLHATDPFKENSMHGVYGDEVEELDWSVGKMLKGLNQFGLDDNTLVYFSSDNGGHIEEYDIRGHRAGGHNGIYKGSKGQGGQEGGIRMPSAIVWPGKIPSGSDVTEPTSQMDIFSTFVKLAGGSIPNDRIIDGKDLMPLLQKKQTVSPHEFMFHYCCSEIHAIRYRPISGDDVFKLHYHWPDWDEGTTGCVSSFACSCYSNHSPLSKPKLFNVAKDPSENYELDTLNSKYADIVRIINKAKMEHQTNVLEVPNQFEILTMIYRPWLHHFCNFPFFHCKDPINSLDLRF